MIHVMRRILCLSIAFLAAVPVFAVTQQVDSAASAAYSEKYDLLVSRLGPAGVGIETVLNSWSEVDPDNR